MRPRIQSVAILFTLCALLVIHPLTCLAGGGGHGGGHGGGGHGGGYHGGGYHGGSYHHGGYHHGSHGHHYGSSAAWFGAGLFVGAFAAPWYYYPRYYYPPAYYYPAPVYPPVYTTSLPPYAYPAPNLSGAREEVVTVPGQSVNGVWVPEHQVRIPAEQKASAVPPPNSGQQAPQAKKTS